jgi:hypothetical protein|tara:strand:- start:281 stop:505 length:225 start_codon:yes stop_codon:yes gene_type:complete
MRSKEDQIVQDIAFCVDELELNDEQIGIYLRASDELGVSCEYLAEEFIFESETQEEFERLHLDPEYLKINWRLN